MPISERTQKILNLLQFLQDNYGGIKQGTYSFIKRQEGLSKDRVRQIAQRIKIKRIRVKDVKCRNCNKPYTTEHRQKYCSDNCIKEFYEKKYWIVKTCFVCRRKKKMLKSAINRNKLFFCKQVCHGVYMGKKNKKPVNGKGINFLPSGILLKEIYK